MVNMTEHHKCSCKGDCSKIFHVEGELCGKCATCTNGDCCKQDNTDESHDDSKEDDTRHGGRQGDACRGKTTPGNEKVDTQRTIPTARWSAMNTNAWLRSLGAQTSLQHGALTAKLTKRGNHIVVKSWNRRAASAEHSEQRDTCRKTWEAAVLRRMLETAEVDIDTTKLTMKLERATAQKEASDSKVMRKTLAAAESMTLKMATNRHGAKHVKSWRMNVAVAQSNERA